EKLGEYGFQ
nr:enkephalin-related peptide [Bos taurus]